MKQTEINATSQGNSHENPPKTAADLPRPPRYVSLHERTAYKKGKWTREEDEMLKNIVSIFGERKWRKIARYVKGRSAIQCLQRWSKILKPGVVKGPWSIEEDQRLLEWVSKEGPKKWAQCARLIPGRSGKQCRERWLNNLNPNIKKGKWTDEEDRKLFELYKVYGSAWSKIATHLEGRTENCVKNRYYSTLRKQAQEKKAEILKEEMMTKVEKGATNNEDGAAGNEGENPESEKPTKASKKAAAAAASSDEPNFKKKLVKRRRRNLPALIEEKNSSVPRREEIHHNLNLMVPENPDLVKRLPQSQPPLERVHQPMEEVRDINRPRLNPPQCDQEKQKILSLLNHISELETLLSRARGELSYLENEFLNHVSRNF